MPEILLKVVLIEYRSHCPHGPIPHCRTTPPTHCSWTQWSGRRRRFPPVLVVVRGSPPEIPPTMRWSGDPKTSSPTSRCPPTAESLVGSSLPSSSRAPTLGTADRCSRPIPTFAVRGPESLVAWFPARRTHPQPTSVTNPERVRMDGDRQRSIGRRRQAHPIPRRGLRSSRVGALQTMRPLPDRGAAGRHLP